MRLRRQLRCWRHAIDGAVIALVLKNELLIGLALGKAWQLHLHALRVIEDEVGRIEVQRRLAAEGDAVGDADESAVLGNQHDFIGHARQLAFAGGELQVFRRIEFHVVMLALQQELAMVGNGADAVRMGKQRNALARVHAVALARHRLQVLLRHRIDIADGIADDGLRTGKADAGGRRDGNRRRTAQFGTGLRIAAAFPAFQAVLQFLLRFVRVSSA